MIRFNVAFGNRSQGFYANHHPGGLDFLNNTAFDNGTNFDMLVEGGTSTHVLHNNVAMAPGTAIARFTGGMNEFNSWDLDISVSAADFQSTAEADALLPRQADGVCRLRRSRDSRRAAISSTAARTSGSPSRAPRPISARSSSGRQPRAVAVVE